MFRAALLALFASASTLALAVGCSPEGATSAPRPPKVPVENPDSEPPIDRMTMKLTINATTFTVSVDDNETSKKFLDLLPITLNMSDLNSNEKYCYLPHTLPTAAVSQQTVERGDLMLFGSSTLVLFYQSFRSSYPYTRIGRVEGAESLAATVGEGSVTVKFEKLFRFVNEIIL